MWGKKPALLHHSPRDYPAAFSRGIPAARTPTAPLPCPDKVHPCCFSKGPPEQDSCTSSLCHARAETTCSCRAGTGPSRQQRDNNPRLLSPAQPRRPGGSVQTCFFPLHFPAPSTASGTVLEERARTVAPRLSASGSTEGAFALCHIPRSSQPLCTNTFTCVLLLRGRGACPITPTPQSPCPARGQPSCSSRARPGRLPRSGHVPGQLGHCNAPAQGGAEPSWTSQGCCQLPHPRQAGPSSGSHLPWQCSSELGKPVPGGFSASSRAWSTKPSLCVGHTGSGSHWCLLVAPLLHTLVRLVLVLLAAVVALAVVAQGCPGVLGASRVQKAGPTTRAPNAREDTGAVQSCPADTSCTSGSIQGKAQLSRACSALGQA